MTGEFLVVGREGDYFYLRYSQDSKPEEYRDDRDEGGNRYSTMIKRVHWLCNDEGGRRMVLVTSAGYERVMGQTPTQNERRILDNDDRTDLYTDLERLTEIIEHGFGKGIRTITL